MEPLTLLQFTRPDPGRAETLVSQIYADLRTGMTSGAIPVGTRLPSSRRAAAILGVSRNTVNTAYDLLRAEGLVEIALQRRPVVTGGSAMPVVDMRAAPLAPTPPRVASNWTCDHREPCFIDRNGAMAPGRPDPALFPHEAWARTLRRASRHRLAAGISPPFLPALLLPAPCARNSPAGLPATAG
jgi:GntR family transcriptional regulator/MocR family aminotransferase